MSDVRGLEECFQEEGRDGIPVNGKETRAQIWEFPKVNTGLICLNILLCDFRSPCHSDDGKEEESVGINVGVYGPFTRLGMTRRGGFTSTSPVSNAGCVPGIVATPTP